MGPSRGGLSTKIHVVTKAGCLPLAIHLTPGLTADIAAARDALSLVEARPREVLADKGYDADDLRLLGLGQYRGSRLRRPGLHILDRRQLRRKRPG